MNDTSHKLLLLERLGEQLPTEVESSLLDRAEERYEAECAGSVQEALDRAHETWSLLANQVVGHERF